MARVIVFGIQDFAELADYYLSVDSDHHVEAFTVERDYLPKEGHFRDRPIVAFEELSILYPPGEFSFFAPISHMHMNNLRARIYRTAKEKGYTCISYISSKATRFNNKIGENCFILEDNTLQPYTHIGNNVVLWSGNHIGHHGQIDDHAFFTSHVVMSGHVHIGAHSFVGVNATIRDGVQIGEYSLIGMGALVTKSTEPYGVYMGSPAKKKEGLSTDIV